MRVNSPTKVANLNADTIDGRDSSEFGLVPEVEPWHEVGGAGEPAFEGGFDNDATEHSRITPTTVAFYKDPFGVVHLRGAALTRTASISGQWSTVFTLPAGYRPPATVFPNRRDELLIQPDGRIEAGVWTANDGSSYGFAALEGISFRAAE